MHFIMQEGSTKDDIQFPIMDLSFHGEVYDSNTGSPLDQRSLAAFKYISNHSKKTHKIIYDSNEYKIAIDKKNVGIEELAEHFPSKKLIIGIESTTLNLSEIYLLLKIFLGHANIYILYVEPDYYTKDRTDTSHKNKSFALSEKTAYQAIPSAVVDLSRPEVKHGVFFLGFEGHRLNRLLEEHQHIAQKDCTMVFGVPPFVPNWEMNSYLPNLPIIKEYNKIDNIEYCSANNPQSSLELLQNISKLVDFKNNEKMFIAPIGTKPCGIAAAVFCLEHPNKIGLLYDHPQKSIARTSSLGSWHVYRPLT